MKIAIIGTGYVGLVTGTCLAELGHEVTCVDVDEKKIERLNAGECPIYEPGLSELISKNVMNDRLFFVTDLSELIDSVDVVFSAVGTPMGEGGAADLRYVKEVAKQFGQMINKYTLFVTKSTVPVGTAEVVREIINKELRDRHVTVPFDVASNPEFLKEGSAVNDFLHPDRIVLGVDSITAKSMLQDVYSFFSDDEILITDIPSAEMIKYASNAMLATRISFMNEIANLCEKVGADVTNVAKGMGLDKRIGPKFLNAGCGYGGSCFPKDVRALIQTGKDNNVRMKILESVENVNHVQKKVVFEKLVKALGTLEGKTIGILGLSFKPNTDDVREATAEAVIELLNGKCRIKAYDPKGMVNFSKYNQDFLMEFCYDMETVFTNTDAVLVLTEWPEFVNARWDILKNMMSGDVVIDGRNCLDKNAMTRLGYTYFSIGR